MRRLLVVGLVASLAPAAALAAPADGGASAPLPGSAAPARPRLEVRLGRTPTVDGVLSPGEWDDAGTVHIDVAPGWRVPVRFKHDGAFLHVAFSGLKHGKQERYPEVLVSAGKEAGAAWGPQDWWFHASYRDCDGQGRPNQWECAPEKPGWTANNFPLQAPGVVELRIAFSRLGQVPGSTRPLGLAFNVTDTREAWHFWPAGATLDSPASWAEATSPDAWNDLPPTAPLRGRVESFTLESQVLKERVQVPVYLPAGHTKGKPLPVLFTLLGFVFFEHPAVQLPRRLELLAEAERLQAVVVGIPGSSAEGSHFPDTAAARALQQHVAGELLPEVVRRYGVSAKREERWLLGFSGGANMALDLAVRHPELFGRVALISPGWMDWDGARNDIGRVYLEQAMASVRTARKGALPALWLAWGDGTMTWETRARAHADRMVRTLEERGATPVVAPALAGEHGLHLIPRALPTVVRFLSNRAP